MQATKRRKTRTKATTPIPFEARQFVHGHAVERAPETPAEAARRSRIDVEASIHTLREAHKTISSVVGSNHPAAIAVWHAFEHAQIAKAQFDIVIARIPAGR